MAYMAVESPRCRPFIPMLDCCKPLDLVVVLADGTSHRLSVSIHRAAMYGKLEIVEIKGVESALLRLPDQKKNKKGSKKNYAAQDQKINKKGSKRK